MKAFVSLAVSCVAALATSAAPASAQYPDRPITVVVPYAAGGAGDVAIRAVAEPMEMALGQKLIVTSRPGAGGNIGGQAVATAAPDGYMLLLGATNNFVINQFLFPNMTFDPLTAFVPIARVADVPSVLFTHPSTPAKTLPEFIAHAKANPGKLNFGSPSFGTTPHLSVERLKLAAAINLVHVPFQGAPPAMQALLRNDIQLYLGGVAVGLGHLEAGTIRALAVSSGARMAALPDVPTITESGVSDFGASNFWLLAAPKGTPDNVVMGLHKAVRTALDTPAVKGRFAKLGFLASSQVPAELAASLKVEAAAWERVVKTARIALPK